MAEYTVLTGLVFLGVIPVVVWESMGLVRAGFDNAFWDSALEEKLPRIAEHRTAWQRQGIAWVVIAALLGAGFVSLTFQLATEGETGWAAVALGGFLVTAAAFAAAIVLMVVTIATAADIHRETGTLPPWAMPSWTSSWLVERVFLVVANLAYVAWGVGIVGSGFPATWVGWFALVTGALVAGWVSLSEKFFPHLVLVVPIALGIALVIH